MALEKKGKKGQQDNQSSSNSKGSKDSKTVVAKDDQDDQADTAATEAVEYDDVIKIDTGDVPSVKHLLDEHAAVALIENGYDEDVSHSNWKLLLGFVACAFALTAQFYAIQFAESPALLKFCVCAYFVLHFSLQIAAVYLDGNIILITLARREMDQSEAHVVVLESSLEHYTTNYTLTFSHRDAPKTSSFSKTLCITRFFDVNGVFLVDEYHNDVTAVLREWHADAAAKEVTGGDGDATESKKTK